MHFLLHRLATHTRGTNISWMSEEDEDYYMVSADDMGSRRAKNRTSIFRTYKNYVAVILFLAVIVLGWPKNRERPLPSSEPGSSRRKEGIAPMESSKAIKSGSVTGVPYYQCGRVTGSGGGDDVTDLVLLHGAAFTKENWKTSGILEMLCSKKPSLSVVALDLSVRATHTELHSILAAIRDEKLVSPKPVALVTPSASGSAVSEWVSKSNQSSISGYVRHWIPVASYSVQSIQPEDLEGMRKYKDSFSVLSIYGDEDPKGKPVSDKLQQHTDAKVVELKGRHPVYLDSPKEFVDTVVNFIEE